MVRFMNHDFFAFSGADNWIGNEGASALAEALAANATLVALDLGCVLPSFQFTLYLLWGRHHSVSLCLDFL